MAYFGLNLGQDLGNRDPKLGDNHAKETFNGHQEMNVL